MSQVLLEMELALSIVASLAEEAQEMVLRPRLFVPGHCQLEKAELTRHFLQCLQLLVFCLDHVVPSLAPWP